MRFVYPEGKKKALTFSYDDGQIYDRRLAELLRSHGLIGTFHLNSGKLDAHRGNDVFVGAEELGEIYAGHEIACHGVEHRNPSALTDTQLVLEILEDRRALEKLTGSLIQGMSYAFGSYDERVIKIARSVGIKYSRTVNSTRGFFPPADFMQWHPTCHHADERLFELGEQFLRTDGFDELPLMYVWGHSFEFERSGNWDRIEEFAEKMAGREDVWYASNLEICTYLNATRQQEFSADGQIMYNSTAVSVWMLTRQGLREVKPGETVSVEE